MTRHEVAIARGFSTKTPVYRWSPFMAVPVVSRSFVCTRVRVWLLSFYFSLSFFLPSPLPLPLSHITVSLSLHRRVKRGKAHCEI